MDTRIGKPSLMVFVDFLHSSMGSSANELVFDRNIFEKSFALEQEGMTPNFLSQFGQIQRPEITDSHRALVHDFLRSETFEALREQWEWKIKMYRWNCDNAPTDHRFNQGVYQGFVSALQTIYEILQVQPPPEQAEETEESGIEAMARKWAQRGSRSMDYD